MRALLLHNPTAGHGFPSAETLLALLRRSGFSPTYCSSKDPNYKQALREATDLVVVAGGDGTVAKVVRHLGDRSTPVAILPLGTANNIARSLDITGTAEDVIAVLTEAPRRSLDIGLAEGPFGCRRFVEGVGLGALADAIRPTGKKRSEEKLARIARGRKVFHKAVADAEPKRVQLTVDGIEIEGEFLFLEVLNLGLTGPAIRIGQSAAPGDRLLDVVYLDAAQRKEMMAWLKVGTDLTPPPLTSRQGAKIDLTWNGTTLRLDDRVYDQEQGAESVQVTLESEPLQICVPVSALASQPQQGTAASA